MDPKGNPASLAAGRALEPFIFAGERPKDTETAFQLQAANVIGIDAGIGGALARVLAALASLGRAFQ